MLYTVELDTLPNMVDWEDFDPSNFAAELERNGATDAVVSVGEDGSVGFTAQFEGVSIHWAGAKAIMSSGFDPRDVTAIHAYRTPVLVEVAEKAA